MTTPTATAPTVEELAALPDRELEHLAQQAAEQRIELALRWQDHYEGDAPEPETPDPTQAPFCSCDTCYVRETLHASWPFMLELARRELKATAA